MIKSHFKYTLFLLFNIFITLLNAQSYTFRALTMDNGLSNFVVNSFCKDSVGFVWIGTDNCLDRFDGVTIKHYPFSGTDLNKKRVIVIAESTSGQLWAGNALGLWKLNKQKDELELFNPKSIDGGVYSLAWDPGRKILYVGTDKGLYIINNNQVQHIPLHPNVLSPGNHVTGINIEKNGSLWLATWKGLYSFNPATQKKTPYEFTAIHPDLNVFNKITRIGTTLYMGTPNAGVVSFDILKSHFAKFVDVGCDIITDISSDGKERIYVATDGNGIHFLSHKNKRIIESIRYNPKSQSGTRSNSIYSLMVDKEGIIWIGYYQAGVDYSLFQNNLFRVYSFPPYFDSRNLPVRTFIIRGTEKLIGTREGLYYINESKKIVWTFTKNELRSNLIISLCYHKREYYIGTYGGGVSVLNPATMSIRALSTDKTLLKGHVFHFEEDADGKLWLATSGGLYSYTKENNKLTLYANSNSQLLSGNVYYVFFDSTKKGWIATETGLCIFDPISQSIHSNIFPRGFFNNEKIKVIYEDSHKNLFFSPDKGNIYVSDEDMTKFSELGMTKNFQGKIFMSILEAKGKYWFGCENGLISMTGKDDSYHSFGFSDGIPDPVFCCNAAFKDDSGLLWFGNAKGLLYVNIKQVDKLKKCPYPVVFTDLQVNGTDVSAQDKINFFENKQLKLSRNENNLLFRFASLSYTNPSNIVYEYKLEGKDMEWLRLTGKNEVSYADLNPGSYILRVRIQGNKESEAQLQVSINSFFSITFWLAFILIAALIWFLGPRAYKRMKKIILNNELLTLEKFRTQKEFVPEDSGIIDEKYKNTKLSDTECKMICEKLYNYFDNKKAYTNPDLKIVDISQALQCSSHSLSYVFNQYLTKNYYDFINEYRVKEFKRLISDENSSKFTLTALAERCGFSSRASFFRSFKKLTGITPNEYIKSIGKNIPDS
jgi:ligand-binding sensor domain-containing protein/AraC-like DNA-binding protein